MEKYQTARRLVIRRPCPVKIFLVSRLDLFSLCVQGQRNGQRWNFHFLEALEDCKWRKNVFQQKIGILQREIWSSLKTVSSRVIEKFLSVKRLDGFVLYIQGLQKTSSSKF